MNSVAHRRTDRLLARVALTMAVAASLVGTMGLGHSAASPHRADSSRPAVAPAQDSSSASIKMPKDYRVAFVLCNYADWRYEPNSLKYYRHLWTTLTPRGKNNTPKFITVPDYFRDASFGQTSLKGSKVFGWYPMDVDNIKFRKVNQAGNSWQLCVNTALAHGAHLLKYKTIVVVNPWRWVKVTDSGLHAEPKLAAGQSHPKSETFTVDSTRHLPPTPFVLNVKTPGTTYGEDVLVKKVNGHSLTVIRGDNGISQSSGPFAAVPKGTLPFTETTNDNAYVGPQPFYYSAHGQPCARHSSSACPVLTTDQPPGSVLHKVGAAQLQAGEHSNDGAYTSGLGDSVHEIGHTTGYNHSRSFAYSTTDYRDCYDQMSYDYCGLPALPREAGPPDPAIDYDAIDLEFHDWIPDSAIYNRSDAALSGQHTITLHALSDPNARQHLKGQYLDAHLPFKVEVNDVAPHDSSGAYIENKFPTPDCDRSTGYWCTKSRYLTIEYRQLYGFDKSIRLVDYSRAAINDGAPAVGVVTLHLYDPDANENVDGDPGNISYLLDAYPHEAKNGQPVMLPHAAGLQPGDTFADSQDHTYIAINSFNAKQKTATVTFGPKQLAPLLTIEQPESADAGKAVTLSAKLTVDGAVVPDQSVKLSLSNGQLCTAKTAATGVAQCRLTASSTPGVYVETATFDGTKTYLATAASADFTIFTPSGPVSTVSGDGSGNAPAITDVDGATFAAWRVEGSTGIDTASTDPDSATWNAVSAVTPSSGSAQTDEPPAIADLADKELFVAWQDSANDQLDYDTRIGNSWGAVQTVAGSWGTATTIGGPGIALEPGGLVAVWTNSATHKVNYSTLSGGTWSTPIVASQVSTDDGPSVAAAPTEVATGQTQAAIAYATTSGRVGVVQLLNGSSPVTSTVAGVTTDARPAMAISPDGTLLFVGAKNKGEKTESYAYFDDGWSNPMREPDANSDSAPSLATYDTTLTMGWSDASSHQVRLATTSYALLDP